VTVAQHPRYRGPVIDVHVHYEAASRAHAPAAIAAGDLRAAFQLWDVTWPPPPFEQELEAWRALEPRLLRCHVPDLSDVEAPGFEQQVVRGLRTAAEQGAVGVKVWKNLGLRLRGADGRLLRVDDPRLDVMWHEAGALGLPVLIHTGDPPEFWQPIVPQNPRYGDLSSNPEWWYGAGDYPSLEELQAQLERVVERHRETMFVGAHFGCFLPDPSAWFRRHPNFFADTAAAVSEIGKGDVTAARQLFLDHPDRLLFGTDLARTAAFEYPDFGVEQRWDLAEYFELHWRFFETAEAGMPHPIPEQVPWSVTGLDLPDDVLRALYFDNAVRLYKRLPAEVTR
jgi:predicted TIM-barrel fold metal-dependent hydrolase